jgi:hypothetical protein
MLLNTCRYINQYASNISSTQLARQVSKGDAPGGMSFKQQSWAAADCYCDDFSKNILCVLLKLLNIGVDFGGLRPFPKTPLNVYGGEK